MTPYQKKRFDATTTVYRLIKRGLLVRPVLCSCGGEKPQAHHPDYDKPAEVLWMCRRCHSAVHRMLS